MGRDPEYKKIWSMFKGRCVVCQHPGNCIHEIIPRSHGEGTMATENRVVLCDACHDKVHHDGALKWQFRLQEFREERLIAYNIKGKIR